MQARVEVEILELLRERDPEGKYNCGEIDGQTGRSTILHFCNSPLGTSLPLQYNVTLLVLQPPPFLTSLVDSATTPPSPL